MSASCVVPSVASLMGRSVLENLPLKKKIRIDTKLTEALDILACLIIKSILFSKTDFQNDKIT